MMLFETTTSATVRKEIMWLLSNVAAGTDEQAMALATSGWLPLLVKALTVYDAKTLVEGARCPCSCRRCIK